MSANLKSLQNSGQLIGEILKHMEDDKYIVKLLNGPRYVVTCKKAINKDDLNIRPLANMRVRSKSIYNMDRIISISIRIGLFILCA